MGSRGEVETWPSEVLVPRPSSSKMIRDLGVASLRISDVSASSTMNVERPLASSSEAPILQRGRERPELWFTPKQITSCRSRRTKRSYKSRRARTSQSGPSRRSRRPTGTRSSCLRVRRVRPVHQTWPVKLTTHVQSWKWKSQQNLWLRLDSGIPVRIICFCPSGPKETSLGTNGAERLTSTIGCRPPTILRVPGSEEISGRQ